jgi:hypothetical protein
MTDVADLLDVGLAAPPGTEAPATDIPGADIACDVPAHARPESPEFAELPESRQLLRELVLRALL